MRPYDLYHAPPVTGVLKYGETVVRSTGSNYPTKLDHLKVCTREKENQNYIKNHEVHEVLGKAPTEVPIRLVSDDPAENFSLFRGFFSKTGQLACGAGYGENKALRRFKQEGGNYQFPVDPYEVDCSAECPLWKNGKCDISGTIYFYLDPELPCSDELFSMQVNGTFAQRGLRSSMESIHKMTGGVLANIPLKLKIHYEGKRGQSDGKYYSVPIITMHPGKPTNQFRIAVAKELEFRKGVNELLGKEDIFVTGALSEINSREAIVNVVTKEEIDHDFEGEGEPKEKAVEVKADKGVHELFNKAGYSEKKKQMTLERFSDDEGMLDKQKLTHYVLAEIEKAKDIPFMEDDDDVPFTID